MHTEAESRRHNYRIVRAGLKDKSKDERHRTYAAFRLGPIGPLLIIGENLKQQVRPRDEFFKAK